MCCLHERFDIGFGKQPGHRVWKPRGHTVWKAAGTLLGDRWSCEACFAAERNTEGPSLQVLEALALGEQAPPIEQMVDETACSLAPAGRADVQDLISRFQVTVHFPLPTGKTARTVFEPEASLWRPLSTWWLPKGFKTFADVRRMSKQCLSCLSDSVPYLLHRTGE